VKNQPQSAKPKRKWASTAKSRMKTSAATQLKVAAMYLSGAKQRKISRELGIDRETVARVLSQSEAELLVQGYRDALLKIVPNALIGASELVKRLNPKVITDVLRGARVMVDRHEPEQIRQPVQDYSYSRIRFFGKYKRWPTDEEAIEFNKTLPVKPTIKGGLEGGLEE
jgi:hypothetical protein